MAKQVRLPLQLLLDSLSRLPAAFAEDKVYRLWEFHGDTTLFSAIAEHGDSAIDVLIEALDDSSMSRATANGMPVPAGVMYHQALTRMAYYEWDCTTESAQPLCAGWIAPNATKLQLVAAKRAWREALAQGIIFRTE